MIDGEYFRRYNELEQLIKCGYMDFYILKGIGEYNTIVSEKQKSLPKGSTLVFEHITEVLKQDFALTIWKLTENSPDANRIGTLEQYLRQNYNMVSTIALSQKTKKLIQRELSTIRRDGLAHNSIIKSSVSIPITSLKDALDDVKNKFNSLCFPQIDDRIRPIMDAELYTMGFHVGVGVHWMIDHSAVPLYEST